MREWVVSSCLCDVCDLCVSHPPTLLVYITFSRSLCVCGHWAATQGELHIRLYTHRLFRSTPAVFADNFASLNRYGWSQASFAAALRLGMDCSCEDPVDRLTLAAARERLVAILSDVREGR